MKIGVLDNPYAGVVTYADGILARGIISHTAGLYDLYADGEQMFFNAVKYMIPVVPVDPGTDGLVAHYAFENDTTDSSGNGLDGVVVGAPVFVDGVEGMALDFDGESYVDCGNDASLDITGPISMSIWIKPGTDGSVETAPLCKADAIAGWSWQLRYGWNTDKPTVMGFQFNSTGSRVWVYVNQDLAVGQWYHIVGAYDGTTVKCYLDGVETDSAPMTGFAGGPSTLLIGSDGWRSDWIGAIDEVMIYDRALSEGEILYLTGERPTPVDPGSDGLVANYAFENDVNDSSGNGLDGVVVGDPAFVDGLEGMALDFNGDDYVDCGGVAEFSFTDAMTVSTWVNIRSRTTAWMAMIAKGENAWRLGVNNETTGIHFGFTGGTRGWQAANTVTELAFDEWYNVTATYDTNVGALVYIDGVLDASNPDLGGIPVNEMPLLLGENPEATGRLFDGMLDEVRIYNRALSEGEILYLADFNENLVLNPSFEEDEVVLDDPDWEAWATWNPAEGAGSNATIVDTESVDGARSLRVEPIGVENWYFIVANIEFPLEFGADYAITFWAKAEAARPLTASFKAADNSVSWGETGFEITTEWAEYTMTAISESDAGKIEFFCAGVEVPFWLDNVSVYKVGDAPPVDTPPDDTPPLIPGENILVNGGFEDGIQDPWGVWGDQTAEVVDTLVGAMVPEAPIEGTYCLHVTTNSAGANDWDYGVNNGGHVFEAGKKYTVSVWLKCKEGTLDIRLKPEHGADPWEGYSDQVFTMTEEWTEYSTTTPVFAENVEPGSITFHTAFAAGEFWMDDVKFYETE